ncbi:MAG: OmpA family protein, partial [Nannocystaceae bacterium]
AAVDIGTTSPNYEYGPPTPPYQVILGLGWAFDPAPVVQEAPVEDTETEPTPPPPPPTGRVVGTVIDASGTPVADARISIPSAGGSVLLTDAGGNFVGYSLPPGPADVVFTPSTGEPITQTVEVVGGEDAAVTFTLSAPEPPPAPPAGLLDGTFTDENGAGVAGSMRVTGGAVDESFIINEAGRIRLSLDYGEYQATVTAEGYEPYSTTFTVDAESVSVSGTLKKDKPPETPNVSGSSSRIRLKRGIRYSGTSVSSSSNEILSELAVFLKYHPEFKLVEVQVHTDDRGNPRSRSKARADSVISYLTGQGVEPSRLKARGLGDSQPVAVNLTEAGRRKNNRTVLRVREYTGEE